MNDHPAFITVTQGMSGYFAVMMSWNSDNDCYEPWTTGVGRYKEKEDAVREAKVWSDDEGMEYRP